MVRLPATENVSWATRIAGILRSFGPRTTIAPRPPAHEENAARDAIYGWHSGTVERPEPVYSGDVPAGREAVAAVGPPLARVARSEAGRFGGSGAAQLATDEPSVELDQQQELLLEVLRRAGGAPVSYEELRDAGVEYPASVVSELELAGLPLERSYADATTARRGASAARVGSPTARRPLGVRLDARHAAAGDASDAGRGWATSARRRRGPRRAIAGVDAAAAAATLAQAAHAARSWLTGHARAGARSLDDALRTLRTTGRGLGERARDAPRGQARGRWLVPAALVAAAALIVAVTVAALSGAGHLRHASAARPHRPRGSTTKVSHVRSAAQRQAPSTPTTRVSAALAEQLDARGHAQLQAGQLEAAIPVLRQALAATGASLQRCLQPVSETCLTYAYALYDLGRALRLDGHPAAAVPILEHRLEIANQRETVQSELELARREAAGSAPRTTASG